MAENTKGYSSLQLVLHWVIVLLVFFQLVFGEDIGAYHRALSHGEDATSLALGANLHIIVGVAVLVLVAVRLFIRLRDGAPAPVPGPALQVWLGQSLHHIFYFLLFAMPISGLVANYLVPSVGPLHELGKPLFIIFILLHAGAAFYHHFVLKDSTLMRMLKPGTY
jgi:cytochrome b561